MKLRLLKLSQNPNLAEERNFYFLHKMEAFS